MPGAIAAAAVGGVVGPVGFYVLSGKFGASIVFGVPIGAVSGFLGWLRISLIGPDDDQE